MYLGTDLSFFFVVGAQEMAAAATCDRYACGLGNLKNFKSFGRTRAARLPASISTKQLRETASHSSLL
jgi:hypothetical protein